MSSLILNESPMLVKVIGEKSENKKKKTLDHSIFFSDEAKVIHSNDTGQSRGNYNGQQKSK